MLYNSDSVLHISPFFFIFFSTTVYHRILNTVPWAITEGPCCLLNSSHSYPALHHTRLGNPQSILCFWFCLFHAVLSLVTRSYMTLCDTMDGSPPGSSVHGESPGKNTGVGCHALFQGIFPTQGLNPGLPHGRRIIYCLSHQGNPSIS